MTETAIQPGSPAQSLVSEPTAADRALRRPLIIQGGMGVGVSSWQLANQVARAGQLGVVSGTACDTSVARRLQDGDPTGDLRRAIAAFPLPTVAERVLRKYFKEGGRNGAPYHPTPRPAVYSGKRTHAQRDAEELSVLGHFVEVWLAKQGHDGLVGINFLEKLQMSNPPAAYGAILADVDYVLMGAGIPKEIPQLLTDLAAGKAGTLSIDVQGGDAVPQTFDPQQLVDGTDDVLPATRRPQFLAIVSSHVLAQFLARDPVTRPDGFVVEGPVAGGHTAPPRGQIQLDDLGQPVYGPRDDCNLGMMKALADKGLPFWLAGGYGEPAKLREALDAGATGVQVGTLFALSQESGLSPELRGQLLSELRAGTLEVRTSAGASPTGFPFKVAQLRGTLSDPEVYAARPRLCDLGYLRTPYVREKGGLGYRCPAEPLDVYHRKGGTAAGADASSCLCNALCADVNIGQERKDGYHEAPLVTLGADLDGARALDAQLHPGGATSAEQIWTAQQAIDWLLTGA